MPFLFKDPVSLTRSSVLAQILAQLAVSPKNLEEQNGFPHQTYTPEIHWIFGYGHKLRRQFYAFETSDFESHDPENAQNTSIKQTATSSDGLHIVCKSPTTVVRSLMLLRLPLWMEWCPFDAPSFWLDSHDLFLSPTDAREKLEAWRLDYNQRRPRSGIALRLSAAAPCTTTGRPGTNSRSAMVCRGQRLVRS
jgi:hypothetical protein